MGTHPIFEPDFDCLTECLTMMIKRKRKTKIENMKMEKNFHENDRLKTMWSPKSRKKRKRRKRVKPKRKKPKLKLHKKNQHQNQSKYLQQMLQIWQQML